MFQLCLRQPARAAKTTIAAAIALLVLTSQPAAALTEEEAAAVIDIVEKLEPEFGPLAYDEDTADDWFLRDDEGAGLIAKAGFSRPRWRAAFDATICGYLAAIPQSSVDALFAQIRERLARAPRMSAEQRSAAAEFVEVEQVRFERLRTSGQPDASVVKPFTARLQRLLPQQLASE